MALNPPVNDADHIQGNPDAEIEFVEYGDYQCPHCGRAYPIIKNLQEKLGDRMKFVFRNFPLEKIHPQAMQAAIVSEAAALQGKYWEMHDLIFENQKRIRIDLDSYAERLGLDTEQFKQDILKPELQEKIKADFYGGMRSGVNATPSFYINGQKFEGDWEGPELLEFISRIII
nr:DsbA family protein [uncultured Fluviicola sp.]